MSRDVNEYDLRPYGVGYRWPHRDECGKEVHWPSELAEIMQRFIRQSVEFAWLKTPQLGGVNGDNLINLEVTELKDEQPSA